MSDPLQSLFSRCDSVLVFDTETSGLSWQRDEIIEFSAIRLTASGTEEVDEFVRCTRSLPPRIVELTGITDDLLREEGIGKQAFAELLGGGGSYLYGTTGISIYRLGDVPSET